MIVETACSPSPQNADAANNNLERTTFISEYEASPGGQRQYLMNRVHKVDKGGAQGLIYWKPAGISSSCYTFGGQGSHEDNIQAFLTHKLYRLFLLLILSSGIITNLSAQIQKTEI